uniref:GtrA family protein n=1 Tax=Pseudomonas graminis TaxID=158627 RepID=A0A7C2AJC3_9PSED
MSKWRAEWGYLGRYIGSGTVNTLLGFAVIFAAMAIGLTPISANVAGYTVGFILGFVISKKIVFRSGGNFISESVRYLIAFFVAFAVNLFTLNIALKWIHLQPVVAQVCAAATYTVTMYLLARYFVFRAHEKTETREL